MQFMIIRLPDQKGQNETVRDVFIAWQGPTMKKILAAKIKANDSEYIKDSVRVCFPVLLYLVIKTFSLTMPLWKPLEGPTSISQPSWTEALHYLVLTNLIRKENYFNVSKHGPS